MISVPTKVLELIKDGSTRKNVKIVFVDGSPEINNDVILQDTFKMTESICSNCELKFGQNDANQLNFSCVSSLNLKDKIFDCILEIDISSIAISDSSLRTYYSTAMECYAYPIYYGRYTVFSCKRQADDWSIRDVEAYSWGYTSTNSKTKNTKLQLKPFERSKLSLGVPSNIPYKFNLAYFLYANIPDAFPDSGKFTNTELSATIKNDEVGFNYAYTGCKLVVSRQAYYIDVNYDNFDALYYVANSYNQLYDNLFKTYASKAADLAVSSSPNTIDWDAAYSYYLGQLRALVKTQVYISNGSYLNVYTYDKYFYPYTNVPSTTQKKYTFHAEVTTRIIKISFVYNEKTTVISSTWLNPVTPYFSKMTLKSSVISPIFSIPRVLVADGESLYVCDELPNELSEYAKCFAELNGLLGRIDRNLTLTCDSTTRTITGLTPKYKFSVLDELVWTSTPLIDKSDFVTCWYDDSIIPYGKVKAEFTENDEKQTCAVRLKKSDDTYYTDNDEFLIYDMSDNLYLSQESVEYSVVKKALGNIASQIKYFNFYAINLDMRGVPYVEAGGWIRVTLENDTVAALVTNRTVSGINDLKDEISTQYTD